MIRDIVITGAARTPIGSFGGSLAELSARDLGAIATGAALRHSGAPPGRVDEVIMGNVLSAGQGQNVARQIAIAAGLPEGTAAHTLNMVCGSGMQAVVAAAQAIQCGDAERIVAGGTESMSRAPHLLPQSRTGTKMGHVALLDSLLVDGLWDCFRNTHMGNHADATAAELQFEREELDDYAVVSYQRALKARSGGHTAREMATVSITGPKGEIRVEQDDEPERFNEPKLRKLRPAFTPEGTTTPGNASSMNDGAAALVLESADHAAGRGATVLAHIAGYARAAREPERFTLAPALAIRQLLARLDWSTDSVDLWEINEAFATVALATEEELELDTRKVNVYGGAVALGHPIGASGARIVVTLLNAMRERDAKRGVAAICIGGGQALALALTRD